MDDEVLHAFKKETAQIHGSKFHQGCLIQRLQFCFREFLNSNNCRLGMYSGEISLDDCSDLIVHPNVF